MTALTSIDPRTGAAVEDVTAQSTEADVHRLAAAAATAAPELDSRGRLFRANLLRAISEELEIHRTEIVALADRETALGEAGLNVELTRTAYQARLFAEVLDEGGYLEAAIDHAGDTPMGPGPDLRRMLVPLGPVAVFGASNFPLAFSIPGGDTVSAIAAGCPVLIKAHSSHPATSRLTFSLLSRAAERVDAPEGTFGLVFGQHAGGVLVADPRIKAVSFTGSLSGGRALLDIVDQRSEPIPFYGELASINPVVITSGAAAGRPTEIAQGVLTSITGGAGQLCTKPGLVFVPAGPSGDRLVTELGALVARQPAQILLNKRIFQSYQETVPDDQGLRSVLRTVLGEPASGAGYAVRPRLLVVDGAELDAGRVEECFGPTVIVVRHSGDDQLRTLLAGLPASLTFTVHHELSEQDEIAGLARFMRDRAGRILFNTFPTGVLVSWAQTHGGPWPATNTLHTSVGTTAIRRYLRPVTWQNAPEAALPDELREPGPAIPRRIDGRLIVPAPSIR